MALRFLPLSQEHLDAVRAFNQRLLEAQAPTDFVLPESPDRKAIDPAAPIQWTQYIALDGDEVRGGVIEMDQPGLLNGRRVRALNFQSQLSEGIINRKHVMVATQILRFSEQRGELIFIVGMGSESRPLPRLLKAAGWSLHAVPFFFRVHHPGKFLREFRMLQTTRARSFAARAAASTGIGSLAFRLLQFRGHRADATIREVKTWGDWADEIWRRFLPHCSFVVERDRQTLEYLYPTADPRLTIFLVERRGNPVGWSTSFKKETKDHRYFGNVQLASILDCVAAPEDMRATAILADRALALRGADIVVSNHQHLLWIRAFKSAGFLSGPSNFLLAKSKRLTEAIHNQPGGEEHVHITRGDGDGRVNLG